MIIRKSVPIEGDYGAGKSRLLNPIAPKKLRGVRVESLFGVHETMASILRELSYETTGHYRRTREHLKTICGPSDCFLVMYEANDLDPRVWPYFKRIMDSRGPRRDGRASTASNAPSSRKHG